jgi:hypothetical protein
MRSHFAEARHPGNGTWQCGECQTHIQTGHMCPDCGTVLCDDCESQLHTFPSGARVGKPCPGSKGADGAAA